MSLVWTGVAAVLLALAHLEARRLTLAERIPRSRWLSAAGGISVAYVFIHLLPEVAALELDLVGGSAGPHAVALCGFAAFYGLEYLAKRSRHERSDERARERVFWLHVASFGVYNLLIGYLLSHEAESPEALARYTFAMALHFVVNDAGLRAHHPHRYRVAGRWILAATVLLGWGAAQVFRVGETAIEVATAFLAGGIVLNVIKEELPEERDSSFPAFALGAGAYAALLITL